MRQLTVVNIRVMIRIFVMAGTSQFINETKYADNELESGRGGDSHRGWRPGRGSGGNRRTSGGIFCAAVRTSHGVPAQGMW